MRVHVVRLPASLRLWQKEAYWCVHFINAPLPFNCKAEMFMINNEKRRVASRCSTVNRLSSFDPYHYLKPTCLFGGRAKSLPHTELQYRHYDTRCTLNLSIVRGRVKDCRLVRPLQGAAHFRVIDDANSSLFRIDTADWAQTTYEYISNTDVLRFHRPKPIVYAHLWVCDIESVDCMPRICAAANPCQALHWA